LRVKKAKATDFGLLPDVELADITPPPLDRAWLDRTHLLNYINQSAPRAVIVMAPEGFGKTTLGAQWAAQHPETTAWFTGTFTDTAERMLDRMVCAIRRVVPNFSSWYDENSNIQSPVDSNTQRVCEEIGRLNFDLNFVIDSLERVPNATLPFIKTWSDHIPTNVRTLSLRRNPPLLSYNRPLDMGVLRYMTASDLSFTKDEILRLAATRGLTMPGQEILSTVERLHGWPAAVSEVLHYLSKSEHWEFGVTPDKESEPNSQKSQVATAPVCEQVMNIDSFVHRLAQKLFRGPMNTRQDSAILTAKEIQILNLLDTPSTVESIANTLHLSKNTVKTHLKNIYRKLGVDSRDAAVEKGRELHLF